jgi:hypothetical protein
MTSLPAQKISYSEKIKDDYQWAKDTIDAILQTSTDTNYRASDYQRKKSNYLLFNNVLDQKDFERELDPYGIEIGQLKDEIKPYNKTYNKIQVLLGEELARPFNYRAVLTNADGIKSKLEFRNALLRNFAYSEIQKVMGQLSSSFPQELIDKSMPVMHPDEVEHYMRFTYQESREVLANSILKYLEQNLSLKELKNDGFKHALIAGEEFVYVGHHNSASYLEILNPLGIIYHKSPEVKYIEDGDYAGYKTYMSVAEIHNRFVNVLTEEQLSDLNFTEKSGNQSNYYNYSDTSKQISRFSHDLHEGSYGDNRAAKSLDNVLVEHVEWRSYKKVGFLTQINQFGDEEEIIVDDLYPVPKDTKKIKVKKALNQVVTKHIWIDELGNPASIEYSWIPEIWEGTRIDGTIYILMGPKEYQFRNEDDPMDLKLGYHGAVYNAMNAPNISLMDRMKPFQYLYFIVTHKLKSLIAKDIGKLFHFDITMVDPKIGLEKTLYYLRELNIDIFNPLHNADKPGQAQRGKVTNATDLSTANHIANYIGILQAIDQQISEVAGVTRQREGNIDRTEAVTNANANIQMSAVITEALFFTHQRVWERVLNSLINLTQAVWKNKSVIKQYLLHDNSLATLNLTPEALTNASFGVFVTDSGRELATFRELRTLIQPALSASAASFSDIVKMFKASSVEELEALFEESEAKRDAQVQQQREHEQQMMQQQLQANEAAQDKQMEHEVHLKLIDSLKFQEDQDLNNNGIRDQLEIEKFLHNKEIDKQKLALEEQKIKAQQAKSNAT